MPLTQVVEYLNERLRQLHPDARLGQQAGLRYREGILTAGVAGFRIRFDQVPVVRAGDGTLVGFSAQCRVESPHGHRLRAEALYVHAWDPEEVIFLDRLLRVCHALHHVNQGHEPHPWLAMDVHLRHVSAIPEHHGEVFEQLLERLGLTPGQIVLRLNGKALQRDPHVQVAARSFAHRGYRLLAIQPDLRTTCWDLLRRIGVKWVLPSHLGQRDDQAHATLDAWSRHGIGIWIDRIDRSHELAAAIALGADLVEGELFARVASLHAQAVNA